MQRHFALVCLAALACTVSCGNVDPAAPLEEASTAPTPTPADEPAEDTGSLSFELTTSDGAEFDSFSYAITGPNFSKSGSIDVSNTTTVSALIDGIPPASGYSITLMGTGVAPATECSGSAAFAVTAGEVTDVPVAIACHLVDLATPTPTPVPIPPLAPVVLTFLLLGIGIVRRQAS